MDVIVGMTLILGVIAAFGHTARSTLRTLSQIESRERPLDQALALHRVIRPHMAEQTNTDGLVLPELLLGETLRLDCTGIEPLRTCVARSPELPDGGTIQLWR